MARIPYIENESVPATAAAVERIKAGRRGELLNIYKLLLHSPALAESWFDHLGATRWKTTLDGRLREIVIIRIAQANAYEYALRQHIPALALADGVSLEECDALKDWRPSPFFDDRERAALAYADAMLAAPDVPDDVFEALRLHFDDRAIVELTVLVGTYMMHNRVFTALKVDIQPAKG